MFTIFVHLKLHWAETPQDVLRIKAINFATINELKKLDHH